MIDENKTKTDWLRVAVWIGIILIGLLWLWGLETIITMGFTALFG